MIFDKKRTIIFVIVSLAILGGVGFLFYFVSEKLTSNPYGESVSINNYDQKVKNLSTDYLDIFEHGIFDLVKLNSKKNITPGEIGPVIIRNGSEEQKVIKVGQEYSGSFIVDLSHIGQSYWVQYTYATDPNNPILSGVPLAITCVPPDKVIYKDFDCKDTGLGYDESEGAQTDPIVDRLPHTTLAYEIKAVIDEKNKLTLQVNLFLSSADYSNLDSVVNDRKRQVEQWIRSIGFDPKNYSFDYINIPL